MSAPQTVLETIVLRTPAAKPRWRALLDRLDTTMTTWAERHRSRTLLARFDARLLREIGMSEADRSHECNKPFWRA